MMNRSTQKELIKLMLQLNEMWPQLDLSNSEQQNMVLDILNTVSTKCQKDFSKANAGRYADIMESLGLVIKMTDWHNMGREELTQCISLCQDIILQVINNLRNEKEIKKDIVFLPYKASMWDSLESVWKAAYEDKEHCNAYVIPIPYADLNPDRSIATWHCEREQFPKYVPTLDWREIDLEKWHPDIIFIHNPYDNYNYITSVESRYYAQNLKHCTNKLVYIPYFVLEEPCIEESVEHFVLTAGVLNADKVIVQSEAMRELYINILIKKTEQKDRAYWEKRISGVGSPKIEKVLISKKEDFEMPAKWRTLVEGKKIILYNTSLSAMLQNSDKVCDKLRCVFDIFRKRDDVVLWWRPHPLMKSTFHSMRPQYEEEYLRLEKQYIEEGWGIYDDSFDLQRAICWSDMYYGDMSSVVNMYRKTGKVILIQDLCKQINESTNEENTCIYFDAACADKEKIWAVSAQGGLFRIDYDTGKVEFVTLLANGYDGWNDVQPLKFTLMCRIESRLILAPMGNGYFLSYDLCTKKTNRISRKCPQVAFVNYCKIEDRIIFLSQCGTCMAIYDKKNNIVAYKETGLTAPNISRKGMIIGSNMSLYNGVLYFAVYGTDKILVVDPVKIKVNQVISLDNERELAFLWQNDKRFYFFYLDGSAEIGDTLLIRKKMPMPEKFNRGDTWRAAYNGWLQTSEKVFIMPHEANMAVIVEKNRFVSSISSKGIVNSLNRKGFFPGIIIGDNIVIVFDVNEAIVKIINMYNQDVEDRKLYFYKKEMLKYLQELIETYRIIRELDCRQSILKVVTSIEKNTNLLYINNKNVESGKKIYNYIIAKE